MNGQLSRTSIKKSLDYLDMTVLDCLSESCGTSAV